MRAMRVYHLVQQRSDFLQLQPCLRLRIEDKGLPHRVTPCLPGISMSFLWTFISRQSKIQDIRSIIDDGGTPSQHRQTLFHKT